MTRLSAVLAAIAIVIAGPAAAATKSGSLVFVQEQKKEQKTPTVAGTWTMSVKSPHGDVPMTLTLAQDGRNVTGIFNPHGEEVQVAGEFVNGALTLATAESAAFRVTLEAQLKDQDTLDGYLSSDRGDMPWRAERVKDK
jgi:hypothetical protein